MTCDFSLDRPWTTRYVVRLPKNAFTGLSLWQILWSTPILDIGRQLPVKVELYPLFQNDEKTEAVFVAHRLMVRIKTSKYGVWISEQGFGSSYY